ncbi:MAG: hypothetical protein EON91_00690 [Brevundimonas sp.]|uniref:hypothetical protein n=1 Tax=Brevundimonas sp. TaxID=1871086 RepID=UPI001217DD0E|nr:hypothetical protein [Brevundimonas sp.]RZJ19592.1 MAG: hypothetical protein EON91_00690 [Brevundimonas sp.]
MGVSNYPADFSAGADLAPVEPTLMLGLPPLLLALLLVVALGFLALGWAIGRLRPTEEDTAPGLWKAIDTPLQTAMKANSDHLPGAARTVKSVIEARLGPVLTLAGGLSAPLHQISAALGDAHAGHGHGGHDHDGGHDDHGHDADHDHGHHDAAPTHNTPHPAPGVTVIQTGSVLLAPAPPPHRPPPAKPAPTPAQRLAVLRQAVSDLNDHWCRKDERLADLRAARRALNR